jgi:hypothetical protein
MSMRVHSACLAAQGAKVMIVVRDYKITLATVAINLKSISAVFDAGV